jgi:hypothetical protein
MATEQLLQARDLLTSIDHPKAREWLVRLDELDPVEDRLAEAQHLIKTLRYGEARQVLKTLHHPSAQRLLTALDDVEREKKRRSSRSIRWITGILLIIVLVGAAAFFFVSSVTRTHVYEDNLIRLNYSFPWVERKNFPNCSEDPCKLVLQHFLFNTNVIAVMWEDIGVYVNNDDHYASEAIVNQDTIVTYDWEFKGGPAVLVNFYGNTSPQLYTSQIWFSEGNVIFGLQMVSIDETAHRAFQADFDRVINSVEFKH